MLCAVPCENGAMFKWMYKYLCNNLLGYHKHYKVFRNCNSSAYLQLESTFQAPNENQWTPMNLYFKYGPIIIFFPLSQLASLSVPLFLVLFQLAIGNCAFLSRCYSIQLVHDAKLLGTCASINSYSTFSSWKLFHIVRDQMQSKCLWFISTELNRVRCINHFMWILRACKSQIISIVSGLEIAHILTFCMRIRE